MKKTLQFIVQILTKKNIKIVLMLFVLFWLFFSHTYAADSSNIDTISQTMKTLLSILSWLRIILASIAGKFMVNDMIYWWFLHLDTTLWTLRNVIKNFANFVLWFMLIWTVLKNLFTVWDMSGPLKIIKKSVIAWVLIQMSWFLLWAVIDISTIATSAIWAFPSQFMTQNNEYSNNIRKKLNNMENKTIVFDPKENFEDMLVIKPKEWQSINTEEDVDSVIDTIMPTYNSVWWPLIFIWAAFFDLLDVDYSYTSWSDMFIDVWMGFVLTILYTIMMFFLFLFNFLRMATLWIVIPAMPFVILGTVFEMKKLDAIWWWLFKIWNILKLIFKPVLMVWVLSLLFIIMMFIKWVMWANGNEPVNFSDAATTFESTSDGSWKYNSSIHVDWLLNFNLDWAKNSIADLVVYILWICLMFFLVWTATSGSWIKFIDDTIKWLSDNIKKFLWSIPIIPAWWIKRIWFNKMKETIERMQGENVLVNMAGINVDAQRQQVLERLWLGKTREALAQSRNASEFARKAKEIADGNKWTRRELEKDDNYLKALNTFADKHEKTNPSIRSEIIKAMNEVFEPKQQSEPAASS